jgi:4-amino-4-deoxy-L-arabinose transferase-like glycosyltransferase
LLAIAITLPWMIAIGAATEGRFFSELVTHEIGPKIFGGDHAHGGAPGYYLLWLPVLIFPATYALPAAVRLSWTALKTPPNDDAQAAYRFLIAWAAPSFLFFELMPAKLVHYTLPVYPAIALLCAAGLLAARGKRWRTTHPAGVVMFGVSGALIVGLMAFIATFMPGAFAEAGLRRAIATGLIGAGTLTAAIVGLLLFRRAALRAAVLVACALVFSFSMRERLLPEARTLFVSNEAVATMTRARVLPRDGQPFWVVGFEQPSLIFLTRTSIQLASADEAASAAHAGDSMIIEGRVLDETRAALLSHDLAFEVLDEPARGITIGRGERMALYVGRVAPANVARAGAQPPNP